MKKFLVIAILALACSTTSSSGSNRGPNGECLSTTAGQTCTGVDTYESCLSSKCGAQQSDVQSKCSATISCLQACNCDATYQACETTCVGKATTDCQTAGTAYGTCTASANCTAPVCTTPTTDVLAGGDTTVTGGGCSAAQACCAQLASMAGGAYQAQCDALKSTTDTACNAALQAWQQAGYCK